MVWRRANSCNISGMARSYRCYSNNRAIDLLIVVFIGYANFLGIQLIKTVSYLILKLSRSSTFVAITQQQSTSAQPTNVFSTYICKSTS